MRRRLRRRRTDNRRDQRANERFGLRASFRTIPTFYNTSAGLWFGTGGASVGINGWAIWQWEVAGGVTVRLG